MNLHLEKCVFCGGTPRLIKCGAHKEYVIYQCSDCHESPILSDEASVCEFSARRRWNQRTREAKHIIKTYDRIRTQIAQASISEEVKI